MSRRLTIDPFTPDASLLREAAATLASGGVVAYPTDTLYGLAVDPRDAGAVRRVCEIKGRAPDAAIGLIAADPEQVEAQVGHLTGLDRRLADRFWPGPLSLVIAAVSSLAPGVVGADGTAAVRVPAHAVARGLARAAGHPLTATSANRTGQPPAATADDVAAALGDAIAVILDAGPAPGGPPSTIVRVVGTEPTLVRAGAIAWARVLELRQ